MITRAASPVDWVMSLNIPTGLKLAAMAAMVLLMGWYTVPTAIRKGDTIVMGAAVFEKSQRGTTIAHAVMWITVGVILLPTIAWHVYIVRNKPESRSSSKLFVFLVPILLTTAVAATYLNGRYEFVSDSASTWLFIVPFVIFAVFVERYNNKRYRVAYLSSYGKFDKAIEAMDQMDEKYRSHPNNMLGLVRAYYRTHRIEKAREIFDSMGDPSQYDKQVQGWMDEWEEEFQKAEREADQEESPFNADDDPTAEQPMN